MSEGDIIRWVVQSSMDHGAIIFWWVGSCGVQPVLMPGNVYYWWLDDTTEYLDGTRPRRYD
jgi:hypothetical protein